MKSRLLLLMLPLALLVLNAAGTAQAGRYAYTQHDVLVHKTRLRWALNNLFPSFAPVDVFCSGKQPTALVGGARGYFTIRCTTGLNIPDFIYHLNSSGHEYVTRAAP
jgi:hypothetical protein